MCSIPDYIQWMLFKLWEIYLGRYWSYKKYFRTKEKKKKATKWSIVLLLSCCKVQSDLTVKSKGAVSMMWNYIVVCNCSSLPGSLPLLEREGKEKKKKERKKSHWILASSRNVSALARSWIRSAVPGCFKNFEEWEREHQTVLYYTQLVGIN